MYSCILGVVPYKLNYQFVIANKSMKNCFKKRKSKRQDTVSAYKLQGGMPKSLKKYQTPAPDTGQAKCYLNKASLEQT